MVVGVGGGDGIVEALIVVMVVVRAVETNNSGSSGVGCKD
jgi:hypothetical protein